LVVHHVKGGALTEDLSRPAVALVLGRRTRVLVVLVAFWLAVGDTLVAVDPVENYQRPESDSYEGELGRKDAEASADPRT
jgi:hypothetical protein